MCSEQKLPNLKHFLFFFFFGSSSVAISFSLSLTSEKSCTIVVRLFVSVLIYIEKKNKES